MSAARRVRPPSQEPDLSLVYRVALLAARLAGGHLKHALGPASRPDSDVSGNAPGGPAGQTALEVTYKGEVDPVTSADLQAQRLVVETIRREFPGHAILAEEGAALPPDIPREGVARWIVDPLDGTVNFMHGLPHFCVSIAFEWEGEVQVGVILDPLRDEIFGAIKGQGAKLNRKPLRVGRRTTLDEALLLTGFPYDRRNHLGTYLRIVEEFLRVSQGIRRLGSSALDLAYIAAGRLDGYWEFKLKPWDLAAGMLLVREAGGSVLGHNGQDAILSSPLVIASNPELVVRMQEIITRVVPELKESEGQLL